VLDEVAAGRLGIHDQPVRAPRRERHEHAHAEPAQAEVRLRHQLVVEVVQRGDAAEGAGRRRRRPERVHEVAAGARRRPRQDELLAAHPLDPVRGGDRQHDPVDAQVGVARVAADEGGEAHAGRGPHQRRHQLARGDLHAAGLARHEEHEVEPDVHQPRRAARARS
jgi:hypothetical protein